MSSTAADRALEAPGIDSVTEAPAASAARSAPAAWNHLLRALSRDLPAGIAQARQARRRMRRPR